MSSFFDFHLFHNNEGENLFDAAVSDKNIKTLVLIRGEELPEEERIFLSKILEAVKLNLTDKQVVLKVVPEGNRMSIGTIGRKAGVSFILLFGFDDLKSLGLQAQLPYYHVLKLGEQHYLRAHALSDIKAEREKNITKKAGALWKALKNYFL